MTDSGGMLVGGREGTSVLVGRQPILDRQGKVYAYELLFRNSEANQAEIEDAVQASSTVLVHTFVDLGLDRVSGGFPVFINVPGGLLRPEVSFPFPSDKVVLEVLEDVEPDEAVLAGMRRLKGEGFRFALDDFVYSPPKEPLLALADFVKLDFLTLTPTELREQMQVLDRYPVRLVAEKVETQMDHEFAEELGIDLYQGYYFCRPAVVRGRRPGVGNINLVRMMGKICSRETDFAALKRMVSQDVGLGYRLLRCLNSAAYALPSKVQNVSHAASLLGENKLRQWLLMLAMSSLQGKPDELVLTATVRAGMCEVLGLQKGEQSQVPFTVGLFSLLDAMLDQPMEEVLAELPLSEGVASALLEGQGTSGELLAAVIAAERNDWEVIERAGITPAQIHDAWTSATQWAEQMRAGFRLN